MSRTLLAGPGGRLTLPEPAGLLCSREDGGHLVVLPPRDVWERSELDRDELMHWGFLVAATGRAMIETLAPLRDGCVNYWEAGNWALNHDADPVGPKTPRRHRHLHLHVLGRSRTATRENWRWGESPRFPDFADRRTWAAGFEPLNDDESKAIVEHAIATLTSRYGVPADDLTL